MRKIAKSNFEAGIRTKSFEPQDIINLEIIPDEDCTECEICGFLIAESKEVKEFEDRKLCDLCYMTEKESQNER